MEQTVIRKIDELGRIVLPSELRRAKGWKTGDSLEIYSTGDTVILKLAEQTENESMES